MWVNINKHEWIRWMYKWEVPGNDNGWSTLIGFATVYSVDTDAGFAPDGAIVRDCKNDYILISRFGKGGSGSEEFCLLLAVDVKSKFRVEIIKEKGLMAKETGSWDTVSRNERSSIYITAIATRPHSDWRRNQGRNSHRLLRATTMG